MAVESSPRYSTGTTNLADILERVLDKGIVIAGDIKLFLGGVEILALQIRLVICSVDKATDMGMDWWKGNPSFSSQTQDKKPIGDGLLEGIEERLTKIEVNLHDQSIKNAKFGLGGRPESHPKQKE